MSKPRASRVVAIDRRLLRGWPLPKLAANADKEARGDVLVVGGSRELPGPVLLAGTAALRVGAGRIQVGVARSIAVGVGTAFPEARVLGLPEKPNGELARNAATSLRKELGKCRTLLVGPGMRDETAAVAILREAFHSEGEFSIVLDAAALRALRDRVAARLPRAGVAEFHPRAALDLASPARLVPFLRRAPDPLLQLVPLAILDAVRGGAPVAPRAQQAAILGGIAAAPKPDAASRIAAANHATASARAAEIEAILDDIARDRARSYGETESR